MTVAALASFVLAQLFTIPMAGLWAAQLALGSVVRHAEASVVDETGERGPEPELTLKRSAKRTSLRNSSVTVGPQDRGLKERNENRSQYQFHNGTGPHVQRRT